MKRAAFFRPGLGTSSFVVRLAACLGWAGVLLSAAPAQSEPERQGVLRVCSDPDNLPFSNREERGFENQIARILADELGYRLEYFWWAQRRGFFRNTSGSWSAERAGADLLERVVAQARSNVSLCRTLRPSPSLSRAGVVLGRVTAPMINSACRRRVR